ncbi:CBF-domain-containing protein [Acaromyces ingoldii]|uniref:CBF-domain-containing protein n=1 Tax=Acaromyces ingoldii TaxID=215250 RepID=A0A316YM08_9BASI|nr:CBF-domain-containing protein [Acaromyces ingoldii]PWN90096.1 CBF-domain-containing protein [Acaromyces ingoldii]
MAGKTQPMPATKTNGRAKRSKEAVEEGTATLTEERRLQEIQTALSTSADLNPLYDLIRLAHGLSTKQEPNLVKTLYASARILARSLTSLIKDDRIPLGHVDEEGYVLGGATSTSSTKELSEADRAVRSWLRQRWNESVDLLCSLLGHESQDLRALAIRLLMTLQVAASNFLSGQSSSSKDPANLQARWSESPWRRLITSLLSGAPILSPEKLLVVDRVEELAQDVRLVFAEEYLEKYDDVRFAFCRDVTAQLSKPPPSISQRSDVRSKAMSMMLLLTAIPTQAADLNEFFVPALARAPPGLNKKAKSKKKGPKFAEDGGSDDENGDGGGDDEDDLADWFSDSDNEGRSKEVKQLKKRDDIAGLGSAAVSANEASQQQRRLKRNPPLLEAIHSLRAQKSAFSKAWLAVLLVSRDAEGNALRGELSLAQTHEALVRIHSQILPHLVKPNLLHDFLVDCLDAGGATALLALNALFTLMTSHNLNYPSFYMRLYGLMVADPPFLHVRYRSRFLRLLDVFLSSTHLPAALIASFAKRLSRAALRAPPSAAVTIAPFVWNLLKRHKRCMTMIHREFEGDRFEAGPAGIEDPFDPLERDPLKTRAIDSSLWELASLGATQAAASNQGLPTDGVGGQAHYLASVHSLAKILAEPFTKEKYGLEDFLDLTYSTMFENETVRTLNPRRNEDGTRIVRPNAKEPALAYSLPTDPKRGKRAAAFRLAVDQDEEQRGVTKKQKTMQVNNDTEDDEDREARLAMKEVEEQQEQQKKEQADACNRLWIFS